MIWKIIYKFYYPDKPFVGPIIEIGKFSGMWYPGRGVVKTVLFLLVVAFDILYSISNLYYLITNFDYNKLINFIQYSSFYLSTHKVTMFAIHHKKWESVIGALTNMEKVQGYDKDSEHGKVVFKYKMYSQLCSMAYCTSEFGMLFSFLAAFWIQSVIVPEITGNWKFEPFKCIFYAWLPFDEGSRLGRYLSAIMQTIFGISTSTFTLTIDSLIMVSMYVFAGQLKVLRIRCTRSLDSPDEEKCWKNVVNCHSHFIAIMKKKQLFDSLIWPITFVHILQVSVVCGVVVIQIVLVENTTADFIRIIALLSGILLQLILFYSVANGIIVQGDNLPYGVFESNWVGKSTRLCKVILMLGMGMKQNYAFTAGPFNEMSLSTLMSILKAVYSFYTLLNQVN